MKFDLDKLMTVFLVSGVASTIRAVFHRSPSLWDNLFTLIGGVLFGSLVGYLSSTNIYTCGYRDIITAGAALTGKEVVDVLITALPRILKSYLTKKTK